MPSGLGAVKARIRTVTLHGRVACWREEVPVSDEAVSQIGGRIRKERLRRGISLRALARSVGLSASFISQIETGKCRPSVSTLYAITTELGISVEDVFETPQVTAVAGDGPSGVAAAFGVLAAEAGRRVGPLVRPDEREVLELDSGVVWERLGHVPGMQVDFFLVTYAPGGSSSSTGRLMRHSGTEYGFLLRGELTLTLGFDEHRLTLGDAVSFPSTTPHRYRNDGPEPAVGVWFVAE
jgi:transcriptional regulator with XRE-family HTH domain